jgi:hypothetical protein
MGVPPECQRVVALSTHPALPGLQAKRYRWHKDNRSDNLAIQSGKRVTFVHIAYHVHFFWVRTKGNVKPTV